MHPLCLLLDVVSFVLVEPGRILGAGRAPAVVPVARRFSGPAQGGEEGSARQLDESVPVPYHLKLFEDLPKRIEPR